jgi:hypothetical protein
MRWHIWKSELNGILTDERVDNLIKEIIREKHGTNLDRKVVYSAYSALQSMLIDNRG